jgi:hypothetical protein
MIYNILGEDDSCDITQRVYLVPPMIYNILREQDSCDITQRVYLVPRNSYPAPLECCRLWVELIKLSGDVTTILLP